MQEFVDVYVKQADGRMWCNVCSTDAERKDSHNKQESHKKRIAKKGILSPTKEELCYCITCGLSFCFLYLWGHVESKTHQEKKLKGKICLVCC